MTRTRRRRGAVVGALATAALVAGCGTASGADDGTEQAGSKRLPRQYPTGSAEGEYQATLQLEDGRQVTVRLVEGTGVQERHRASASASWSAWQTLYETDTDRCQHVELQEVSGTVALTADFGRFCSDGEPPTESVAGVGTGDLTDWDIDVTEDFDGWQDTSITDDGTRVVFLYDSDAGLYYQRWGYGTGFEDPVR